MRRRARHEQLGTTRLRAYLGEQRLDAVLRTHRFARHHLVAGHEAFGITTEVDVNAVAIDTLDETREQFTLALLVFLDDLLAFGLTYLLHDDLLRGLRGNAPEFHRFHRLFDVFAGLGVRIDVDGVDHPQFAIRYFQFGRIVGEDMPAPKSLVIARLAVNCDPHVDVLAMLPARCRRQRGFDRLEDDVFFDALLVRNCVDNHQDFFTHYSETPSTPAASSAVRNQPGRVDGRQRQAVRFPIDLDNDFFVVRGHQRALETSASRNRETRLHLHGFTSKPLKMLNFCQLPVKTG